MKYLRFDPSDCGFPMPRVPVLPGLAMSSLRLRPTASQSFPASPDRVRHFARGRYALTQAYLQAGVGKEGALLAPAYHCRTMLDPAIRIGAQVKLYAVGPDLAPDMDALKSQIASTTHPVNALLVPHYFGFPQQLVSLSAFCVEHGITLIEDCSHALSGPIVPPSIATRGVGATGRLCVSSPYKFFPSADGGLLWSNAREGLSPFRQSRPGFKKEIKGLVSAFQKNMHGDPTANPDALAHEVDVLHTGDGNRGQTVAEEIAGVSGQYRDADENVRSLASSRWIFRHTEFDTLATARRSNYRTWLDATARMPKCRALLPELPADCVPYMFPLLLEQPQVHFHILKRLGVPIWRWDDMAVSDCKVASDYRLRLLHLPCHQSLTASQMQWMFAALGRVLSDVQGSNPS